jgi:hypothetical protein
MNRIYGVVSDSTTEDPKISVPMNMMAALVLPLQGFCNCLIYLFFSRAELRKEIKAGMNRLRGCPVVRTSTDLEQGPQPTYHDGAMTGSHEAMTAQEARDLDPTFDYDDNSDGPIDLEDLVQDRLPWIVSVDRD